MREIKFRAWDSDVNDFHIVELGGPRGAGISVNTSRKSGGTAFAEGTVYQQYTGLKDRDGKEIYENDIVQRVDEMGGKPCKVFWSTRNLQWSLHDGTKQHRLEAPNLRAVYEVIGNIYENKDIL